MKKHVAFSDFEITQKIVCVFSYFYFQPFTAKKVLFFFPVFDFTKKGPKLLSLSLTILLLLFLQGLVELKGFMGT